MNLPYFISKRISNQQQKGFSSVIHKVAVMSIAIGLAASIVSFLVMQGFQETVKNKIFSFSGHLVIKKYSMNNSMEETPIDYNISIYNHPQQLAGVRYIQEYAHKAGLIKTNDEILGIVVKGVGKRFDKQAFSENMVDGRFLNMPDSAVSNEVVISQIIANKLHLKTGDDVVVHFFQNPPRFRKTKSNGHLRNQSFGIF